MLSSASISNETTPSGMAVEKYTDSLNRYYQLKSRYEGDISNKKKGLKMRLSRIERGVTCFANSPLRVSAADERWGAHLQLHPIKMRQFI